jgi:hypothetical protein
MNETAIDLRAVDVRISREIFGVDCKCVNRTWTELRGGKEFRVLPYYTLNMAPAAAVWAKLIEEPYVKVSVEDSLYHGPACRITAAAEGERGKVLRDAQQMAETIPLAICLAALAACEVKDG